MRQIKEAHRTGLYELQTPDVLSVEPDSPFDIVRQEGAQVSLPTCSRLTATPRATNWSAIGR